MRTSKDDLAQKTYPADDTIAYGDQIERELKELD